MRIENNSAVSPVIGVLLMVAITVILAAVIAVFVFNMAGTIQTSKIVAVTSSQMDDKTISLTNMGGQDVDSLVKINVTGDLKVLPADLGIATGSSKTYEMSAGIGWKHITAVGTFNDGTSQVIFSIYHNRITP
jgi:flagellin-like protein